MADANNKKPHRWKKGESGNPAGAPKRGESWAELFNTIGNLTGEEASERAVKLWAGEFKKMPKGITLKELVVLRAYSALLDESNARLLKEVMDRAEGKVAERIEGPGPGGAFEIIQKTVGINADKV